MIMQEKIKVMKKNKFRIHPIRFYSAKGRSIQKSPGITHRTHGDSSQSTYPYHTHTHWNPHGNSHTHGSPGPRARIPSALTTRPLSHTEVVSQGAVCTGVSLRLVYRYQSRWVYCWSLATWQSAPCCSRSGNATGPTWSASTSASSRWVPSDSATTCREPASTRGRRRPSWYCALCICWSGWRSLLCVLTWCRNRRKVCFASSDAGFVWSEPHNE